MQDGLIYDQGKSYLEWGIRDETQRIAIRRLAARIGSARREESSDAKQDWATALAWGMLSRDGLDARVTGQTASDLIAAGAREADIGVLADTLHGFADEMRSDAGTKTMIRHPR